MRSVKTDPLLNELKERVLFHAGNMGRTLPEIRFFILDPQEFMSLLEKEVYPTSPLNIWEGKNMVTRRHRVQTGRESAMYYEVVQTGNPSYAYLNETNSPMNQASVMAHVIGHCEFSELNVMRDSNVDRTEYVMYLVREVKLGRRQMGDMQYKHYWNACESVLPLIAPNSQYNLANAVVSDTQHGRMHKRQESGRTREAQQVKQFFSSTLDALFRNLQGNVVFEEDAKKKRARETISRRGYKLRTPCRDVFGFLCQYAPASSAERAILNYLYAIHETHDFVRRTQIMNEGWAMYWEKRIMLELFKEKAVKGMIDYARTFSGVCYPRPYYARNPYHLGYHMWCHIEELYRDGKVSLPFLEETDQKVKDEWHRPRLEDPVVAMAHLVKTITDYEFLRRFLTPALIHKFHLNRVDRRTAKRLAIPEKNVVDADERWIWLNPEPIKQEMLTFFTHFYQPRIYVVDTDFQDGGLLLFHRDDGRQLKKDWIQPTLKNINLIWKSPVYLLTGKKMHQYHAGRYRTSDAMAVRFSEILERMRKDERPVRLSS